MRKDSFNITSKATRLILLLIALGFTQDSAPRAQQTRNGPITVTSVSSHASGNGTVVSIAADVPLNRAQTWQDREGYHVVVPSAGTRKPIKVGSGIKVRQLDHTLEIVIQVKPGANVTVQPAGNHLSLNVDGKLDPRGLADTDNANASSNTPDEGFGASEADLNSTRTGNATAEQGIRTGLVASSTSSPYSGPAIGTPNSLNSAQGARRQDEPETTSGEFSVISGTTAFLMIGLGVGGLGLLVFRRRRSAHEATRLMDEDAGFDPFDDLDFSDEPTAEANPIVKTKGPQENLMKQNGSGKPNTTSSQRKSVARMPVALPAALYGAYKVDQEITKLVHGLSHRTDVVASRAPDDRRAIEASLLKTMMSAGVNDELRRRARGALEEYGFVARQSAALLTAADPYERTSAARMLGDTKSPAALPFLLEALYDHESLVRNQAVLSIGELKLPSAIGALLDIARKHPDVPGTLLSRALSACSVEGLDFFDSLIAESGLLSTVDAHFLAHEIMKLEPASPVQELPECAEDEKLNKALLQVESQDVGELSDAIKVLGQFPTRTSVAALVKIARQDPESAVRALAISSLAFINHESVFPAILIAMADESRGVRAAAARSLSRLSFDRADAYIRVTETDDAETLREVAQACIKAGIATQGIDRLVSGDHQAYEALAVVSLLVKASAVEPLLEAIAHHPNLEVRLTAIYVLGMGGQLDVLEQLGQLADDCPHEAVRSALLETIGRLEASQNQQDRTSETELELYVEPESELQALPECQDDAQPECEFEHYEVGGSGLPAPPIA